MRGGPKDLSAVFIAVSSYENNESNSLNNFAITSAGIGEALKRSASALAEAGNSMDESIGLVTAANSVVDFMPRVHSNMNTSR